jgi:hypothetical protein
MCDNEWVSKHGAATPADIDIDMDASYDLGWDSLTDAGDIDSAPMSEEIIDMEASYHLGWDSVAEAGHADSGTTVGASVGVDLEASHDLGWDGTPASNASVPQPEIMQPSSKVVFSL